MPLGFHYSQAQDWYHAGGGVYGERWDPAQEGDFDKFLKDVSLPQLKELVENYGPVHSIFADTPVNMSQERARQFHAMLPANTVVNDRLGGGTADYWCQEEVLSPGLRREGDWEFCATMNGTWGYKKEPTEWKSREQLLTYLITTVSRGGNFLLNVGPLADGTFPPQAVERFEYIGQWLAGHGESIYGAGACSFIVPSWDGVVSMRIDEKGDTHTYLHFFKAPEKNVISLPRLANELAKAEILGRSGDVSCVKNAKGWDIALKDGEIKPFDVIHLHWKGAIRIDKTAMAWDAKGRLLLGASQAQLKGSTITRERDPLSPEMNVGYWTDVNDSLSWPMEISEKSNVKSAWNIACDPSSAGAEVGLYVGEKELVKWTVPSTKAWTDYQNIKGPSFELPAGTNELTLKALSKPGLGVMNLRGVVIEKE
jgi:alpha-L-fucosidase